VTTLIEFPLDTGGVVLVEGTGRSRDSADYGDEPTRGLRSGTEEIVARAGDTFEAALTRIQPVALSLISGFRSIADAPEEIEVCFGVQLRADFGAVIARAAGEANFNVTLRWKRDQPAAPDASHGALSSSQN
jgi:Trypsin-co-occurring domain 1